MTHNGGRYQTQPWFLSSALGAFYFMNKLKVSGLVQYDNGSLGRPAASILNTNGYPTSVATGSIRFIITDEGTTYRPGNRILKWGGNQTFALPSGTTLVSGSLSGSNGRAVLSITASTSPKTINLVMTATDGLLDNLRWLHDDDETSYEAQKTARPDLEPWGTQFLTFARACKIGVWRCLDMQDANLSNVSPWSTRMHVDHYNYAASKFDPTLYGGVLAGGPSDFTATLSGFALVDGAVVQVDITGATTASGTTTLDVSSTGAKPVIMPDASTSTMTTWSRASTGTNRRETFIYSAFLGSYITFATAFNEGLEGGVPPECLIDLANQLGCHLHVIPPPLTCDTPTDYMPSWATYAAANLDDGLQFRTEGATNEEWNTIFYGTKLANYYSLARYGVSNFNDWYGRSMSVIGAAVSSAFGGDRSRYAVMCGVQSVGTPDNVSGANTSRRIESTRHVAAGGTPASNFVTHVMLANYWTTKNGIAGVPLGTTADQYLKMIDFVAHAQAWLVGDAAAKLAAIDWTFEGTALADWVDERLIPRLDTWSAVAQNYNIFGTSQKLGLTFYEGNYYPGDISLDPTHGIDGVTLGNPTIITINNVGGQQAHAFQAGMRARFRGIGGTTQLNGNTYDVLSATETTVTIDVDSTSFGTFTSGNSGAFAYFLPPINGIIYDGYGNTGSQIAQLYENATRFADGSFDATTLVFNTCVDYPNAEFPADYFLIGLAQWGKQDDLYSTASPQLQAMIDFSGSRRRCRLTAIA